MKLSSSKKQKIQTYKGKIYELKIEKLVSGAVGLSHLPSGEVVMVRYVLPGEVVKAEIVWVENDYLIARAVEVVESSNLRIIPKCPFFSICGGCDLQHTPYELQLQFKKVFLVESLERIGKFDVESIEIEPFVASPKQWNYRNTATFKVDPKKKKIGFFKRDTKFIVDIDYCHILDDKINEALKNVRTQSKFPPHNFKVRATNTGDVVVHWIDAEGYEDRPAEEVVEALGIEIHFRISSESFFQVNNSVIPLWLEKIVELMELNGEETVYDLYSGTGLISFFVSPFAKKVVGIEISKRAVKNARETKLRNGVRNVEFIWGDVKDKLGELEKGDVLIIDPPRAGVDKEVLYKMIAHSPHKIVYSSCNPSTFSRDLKILADGGYKLERIVPVDMFPQTHHIESIALLVKY